MKRLLTLTSNTLMHCMTDLELRDALIRGDEKVTREFLYLPTSTHQRDTTCV